jgi:chromosome segregation ATPase
LAEFRPRPTFEAKSNEGGRIMSDEELAQLQDELTEARAELDALRATAADREARAAHLESQLAGLREELSRANEEGEARAQELAAATERETALDAQVRSAAGRYRELLLQHAPELPEELVAGESVEAIEKSLSRARETVAKVRGHLESQALAARVPVGAPPRSAPHHSALSTEEKIGLGLSKQGGSS